MQRLAMRWPVEESSQKRPSYTSRWWGLLAHGYLSVEIGVVEAILRQRLYRRVAELAVKVADKVGDP